MSWVVNRRDVLVGIAATTAAMLTRTVASRAATDGPALHRVVITDFEFILTVRPGDKVSWINQDVVPHTATASGKTWGTGRLNGKQEQTIEVKIGMEVEYFCRFHPMMKGKLRIIEV